MITLKTLHLATSEEVFLQVAQHLMKQMKKSTLANSTIGKYRGQEGLVCAAGCLIEECEYDERFEKYSWLSLTNRGMVPPHHAMLICRLQDVHDEFLPWEWCDELQNVIKEFGLRVQFYSTEMTELRELAVV